MNNDNSRQKSFECNTFVTYLNSLQRIEATNANSIAESQAKDPNFTNIIVSHPLKNKIIKELCDPKGVHVILTGHAGDGKSTIALEIFKELKNIQSNKALTEDIKAKEVIQDKKIVIIKDFSERDKSEDKELIKELLKKEYRFLIVTNTGTLLDFLKKQKDELQYDDELSIETEVLTNISAESGTADLELKNTKFKIFNLALLDNLSIAKQIFKKMLAEDRWKPCFNCEKKLNCPLYKNISLILKNEETVTERIFLAYQRMYEYGTRLTMRQLTEHFAYCLTGGLNTEKIAYLCESQKFFTQFFFFNRFFGDDGIKPDETAIMMQAIKEIKKNELGLKICPSWERTIWVKKSKEALDIKSDTYDSIIEPLIRIGAKIDNYYKKINLTSAQAREQVRRLIFFLNEFKNEDNGYITQYLNSPNIIKWSGWQKTNNIGELRVINRHVFHVIQEHFTGLSLPEGKDSQDRLYITMSRKDSKFRQTAQIVLAHLSWEDSMSLKIIEDETVLDIPKKNLYLIGLSEYKGIKLKLSLPFLDFVILRHFGELSASLKQSYRTRLDQFKSEILNKRKLDEDELLIIRLRADNSFSKKHFRIVNGNLEVDDA